ncbi:hypothetical protein Q7P37_007108 [Cladosporium fusiforme]
MSDKPQSLAELCSICYTEKPKYRCPGCKTQTCSLPCYKRHQQRASCNGKRDPAAYLKRSEWATPSGIDRDYNYLKSVERHVDRTGEDVRERGISTGQPGRGGERGSASNKKVSKAWVPGSALQKYLSENDIRVEKVPSGMSRQKTNLTRVTHKGNVMWTVEWMQGDGRKSVDDENAEGRQIRELWGDIMAKRLNAEKGKKRKREAEKPTQSKASAQDPKQQVVDEAVDGQSQPTDAAEAPAIQTEASSSTPKDEAQDERSDQPIQDESNVDDAQTDSEALDQKPEQLEESKDGPEQNTPEHFYLLKPFTATKSKVLIPIDASAKLTDCLKTQSVLEYPTIYVLPEGPESLPVGFQLEDDYTKAAQG